MKKFIASKKLNCLALALGLLSSNSSFSLPPTDGNPFSGATAYVNPDYVADVENFFTKNQDYKVKAAKLSLLDPAGNWAIPTAIWLDTKEAIEDNPSRNTRCIRYHLNRALAQAKPENPVVLSFVIYNLPLRDCDAYSSNGKIKNLAEYQTEYIDKIKQIFDEFYHKANSENVRSVFVIEPDSLPNLITNASNSRCSEAKLGYIEGIKYALGQFSSNPEAQISMYIDIAHSGWLGWADNMNQVAEIYNSRVLGEGFNKVRGFISNTSNYTPLKEAFSYEQYLPNYEKPASSLWVMLTPYYSWNEAYDEASFVAEIMSLRADGKLKQQANHRILKPDTQKYSSMHFLIDTSRNGWMPQNYTALNQSTNTSVSYPRADQRHHRGNWCNVQNVKPNQQIPAKEASAGLGELPKANPELINPLYKDNSGKDLLLPIDAYVWIKPPGESDGYYNSVTKAGDQMCGKAEGGPHNQNQPTDSLQAGNEQAPPAGQFFDQAFKNLIDVRGCIDKKFVSAFCPE